MPTTQSGFFLQSSQQGNFELVVPSTLGGLIHRSRPKTGAQSFSAPIFFGSGALSPVALIQSRAVFDQPGYLEAVCRKGDSLVYYCREDDGALRWFGPFIIRLGVFGTPALLQNDAGHFEIVTPLATGGMAQITRDNSDPAKPWVTVAEFAGIDGLVDGVGLIQSSFGPGNLELVANVVTATGNALAHYWRDAAPGSPWNGPGFLFADSLQPAPGAAPALIQGRFGVTGNFELVIPVAGGGLAYLSRNNDDAALSWSEPVFFGSGDVSSVSLLQSDIGQPGLGNLEVAAQVGGETHLYFRTDQEPFNWSGPTVVPSADILSDSPTEGQWTIPYSSGVVGIHAAVLHTGKVLFFSYHGSDHAHGGGSVHDELSVGGEGVSSVLDPETGSLSRPVIEKNLFCAGQALMPDGRLLVAGGGGGDSIDSFHTFTPQGATGTWKRIGLMTDKRWYPTVSPMLDGRMFVVSGTRVDGGPETGTNLNDSYEIYDPATDTHTGLTPLAFLNEATPFALFPFCYHLPNGKMLIHAGRKTHFIDPGSGAIDAQTATCVRETERTYRLQGTSVLLPLMPDSNPPYRARVMVIGGGGEPVSHDAPATSTCEILDTGAAPLAWKTAGAMQFPRVMCDSVLLPDGTVLVTNGSATGQADNGTEPVFPAEIYDPATDKWTKAGSTRVARLYHSTAVLLPDGRVLTAGKDEDFNPEPFKFPELRLEVFSPPYLFRGPRPVIASAPAAVPHGAGFTIESPDAASIASACFIRPSAVTHSFNMSQRLVGLKITGLDGSQLQLEAPPAEAAPPGFYMLFAVNNDGVPSVAKWVKLS